MKPLLTLLLIVVFGFQESSDFKTKQMKYGRVRSAYQEKLGDVDKILNAAGLAKDSFRLFIQIFKNEELIDVWGGNSDTSKFRLITQYEFCSTSGSLGPKRQEGDYQIPEGFYYIDRFNPWSNFHLSLGINYPNASDRILGNKSSLGGDIFIHGDCVTIGCIPITDDKIKELYILAIEARKNGQAIIPVYIFPARLDDNTLEKLAINSYAPEEMVDFWANLKLGYDYFQNNRSLPKITVSKSGRYQFQ